MNKAKIVKTSSARVIVARARKKIEALQEDLNALVETTDYEKLLKAHEEALQKIIMLESVLSSAGERIRAGREEIAGFRFRRDQRLFWEDQAKQMLETLEKVDRVLSMPVSDTLPRLLPKRR